MKHVSRLAATASAFALVSFTSVAAAQVGSQGAQAPGSYSGSPTPNANVDGMRLRGGLSVNGGLLLVVPAANPTMPGSVAVGGSGGLGLRLGVQFNHLLAVYYQGTALLGGVINDTAGAAIAGIFNSVMLNLTLGDMFEIGAGPSFDFGAAFGCSATSASCADWTGFAIGAHGRLALVIGGRWPGAARRSGLSIGIDLHPMFQFDGVIVMSATGGVGFEFF